MPLSLLEKIIDLLFPRYCAICDNRLNGTEEMLCVSCLRALPFTNNWKNPEENRMTKMFWGRIPIERGMALYYYHSHANASYIIYNLKYHHRPDAAVYLGRIIANKGIEGKFFEGIDAIIPIPITKARRRYRGYNQSEEIAKGIREKTQIPIITDAIRRVVFTESQTKKNKMERLGNVENVFRLSDTYSDDQGKHPITDLAGKHLLVVDDVCTTGATIVSCCKELQKAGKMRFSIATIGWVRTY